MAYLADNLDKNIAYSDYLADDNLDKNIAYSEYISVPITSSVFNNKRIEKLKKIFNYE